MDTAMHYLNKATVKGYIAESEPWVVITLLDGGGEIKLYLHQEQAKILATAAIEALNLLEPPQ